MTHGRNILPNMKIKGLIFPFLGNTHIYRNGSVNDVQIVFIPVDPIDELINGSNAQRGINSIRRHPLYPRTNGVINAHLIVGLQINQVGMGRGDNCLCTVARMAVKLNFYV